MPGLIISNEPIGDKPIIRGLQVDNAAASVVLPMTSFVDPEQASKEDQVPPGGGGGIFLCIHIDSCFFLSLNGFQQ
jgi:hypothetical protein